MPRLLPILASALLVLVSTVRAASPLAGHGSGRVLLSGDVGQFRGIAQQSITGFSVTTGRIVSNLVVGSTPFAVEITDQIAVSLGRVKFRTNFTLANGNDTFVTLTGRAHVSEKTISYSASSSDGALKIRGVIRFRRGAITRTETRQDSGSTYAIRTTVYP